MEEKRLVAPPLRSHKKPQKGLAMLLAPSLRPKKTPT